MRKLLVAVLTACVLLGASSVSAVETKKVTASVSYLIEAHEWGPSISKTVIKTSEVLPSVNVEDFKVVETKYGFNFMTFSNGDVVTDLTPAAAYYCDENGNKVAAASEYVAIEWPNSGLLDDAAYLNPTSVSPFNYDFIGTGHNDFYKNYKQTITYKGAEIEQTGFHTWEMPEIADWSYGAHVASDDIQLNYAYYSPKADSKKNPLFIWLHGAGEGGTNPQIVLYGNEVSALAGDDFQNALGGAYVLAPQAPTAWMDNGTGSGYSTSADSMYMTSLWETIQDFVNSHPDIDQSRIYIGGCSNGGYMTMNMIIAHPTYFAAAVPICEALADENISDADLQGIKNLPVWFIAAKTDTTVPPESFAAPTFNRLSKISKVAHFSYYDSVVDNIYGYKQLDGTQGEYMGHYSWVYFFNNEVKEGNVTLFNWLAKQKRGTYVASTTSAAIIKDTADAKPSLLERVLAFLGF